MTLMIMIVITGSFLKKVVEDLLQEHKISKIMEYYIGGNILIITLFFLLYVVMVVPPAGFTDNGINILTQNSWNTTSKIFYFSATNNFYAAQGIVPLGLAKVGQVMQYFVSGMFNIIIIAFAINNINKKEDGKNKK
jgi:hypothetical protein